MASTSETGHAKNVANFETLIAFCTGYGAAYNPARAELQLPALTALHQQAQNSLTAVTAAKHLFVNATNARQDLFEPLKKTCTRIISALAASGAPQKLIADAKTINNKIQGRRSKPKPILPDGELPPDKAISVSQQSYHSITQNFADLVNLVSSTSAYTPNETDLQSATLTALINDLRTANTQVANAYAAYVNARVARNQLLYDPLTGLKDIAAGVKEYIKSLYGTTDIRYKQVSTIEFKKPQKL